MVEPTPPPARPPGRGQSRRAALPSGLARRCAALLLSGALVVTCTACAAADEPRPGSFTRVFDEVLLPRCSGEFCHGSPTGGELVLSTREAAHRALVAVPAAGAACGAEGGIRVVPGDPDASLLVQKLESPAPCGRAMPPGAPLGPDELELVRAWIDAGAPLD